MEKEKKLELYGIYNKIPKDVLYVIIDFLEIKLIGRVIMLVSKEFRTVCIHITNARHKRFSLQNQMKIQHMFESKSLKVFNKFEYPIRNDVEEEELRICRVCRFHVLEWINCCECDFSFCTRCEYDAGVSLGFDYHCYECIEKWKSGTLEESQLVD